MITTLIMSFQLLLVIVVRFYLINFSFCTHTLSLSLFLLLYCNKKECIGLKIQPYNEDIQLNN